VIAKWSELSDRKPAHALVEDVDLVVVRYDDEVSVLYGRCLHRGALMADGYVDGKDLICGVHYWDYRLDTGVSAYNNHEVLAKFGVWVDKTANTVSVDRREIVFEKVDCRNCAPRRLESVALKSWRSHLSKVQVAKLHLETSADCRSQKAKVQAFLFSESNQEQPTSRVLANLQPASRIGSNLQSVKADSEKSALRIEGWQKKAAVESALGKLKSIQRKLRRKQQAVEDPVTRGHRGKFFLRNGTIA
jgi:nitrite reductase/ring-hydroxylating ferredoxin subunit